MSPSRQQYHVRDTFNPILEARLKTPSPPAGPTSWLTKLPLHDSLDVDMDRQISACVLDLLTHDGIDITSACKTYFNVMTPRLPIISEKLFLPKFSHLYSAPDSHFSLLLLCMTLVCRNVIKPGEPNLPGTMYYTAKSFFAVLCTSKRGSLELLQSAVLLAQYEYCQGLLEASRFTLSTCANMAYSLGLDKMLKTHFSVNISTRAVVETGRCLWWSIFILERYETLFTMILFPRLPFSPIQRRI